MQTYYIGYSTDDDIRFRSASGGVGTAIIKYLLESKEYGTGMTFVFNKSRCQYEPKLIYGFDEYNNCGSVYQDTDTIGFIKANLQNIRDGVVVTCMPCQVRPIKSILNRSNIKHFIVSLFCSGQTTVQGTWQYYSFMGIRKEDVENIQYRGNGWPSGIQIRLKNGDVIRRDNYTYPWTLIQKSLLFRPKRCLSCTLKTSPDADVTLADPWLKEYIENDHAGNSIIICNKTGAAIVKRMENENKLSLKAVDEETYVSSQRWTIQEKTHANQNKVFNRVVGRMGAEGSIYKKCISKSEKLFRVHMRVLRVLRRYLVKS